MDESETTSSSEEEEEEEDELSYQLREEKKKALSILESVLSAPSHSVSPSHKDKLTPLPSISDHPGDKMADTPGDKSFSVRGNLRGLFGASGGHTFAFHASDSDGEGDTGERPVSLDTPHRATHTPQSGSKDAVRAPPKLFFFHSDNKSLRNRLDENSFYRSCPVEELERGWAERRAAMTHSYRTRHRDAVRLARKSKRTRKQ